jgi:hypothetical protein
VKRCCTPQIRRLTDECVCSFDLQKKAIYWDWEYVRHLMRFGLRQLGFGLVALVARPLLGVLIPIAQFGYRYEAFVVDRGGSFLPTEWGFPPPTASADGSIRHMEATFLVPVFVAFVFPATRDGALQLVHMWLDSRTMIRELFDPIIARLKSAAKDGDPNVSTDLLTDMEIDSEERDSRAEQRDWHQSGSDAARLGFGLVFCYMQQVPFLGPFAWFMGFASAGLFAPELVDLSAFGKKAT